eukprot:scaffold35566_cov70-Phaeocystis_antarctica.AAC.1
MARLCLGDGDGDPERLEGRPQGEVERRSPRVLDVLVVVSCRLVRLELAAARAPEPTSRVHRRRPARRRRRPARCGLARRGLAWLSCGHEEFQHL